MIFFHRSLQDGSLVKYLDGHPQQAWVPAATYYLGQGYYLFQDLPEAATYFQRVAQNFPKHSLADDAEFSYIQCLDDMASLGRLELIEGYQAYLTRFPQGRHLDTVTQRIAVLRTSSR